MVTRRNLTRGNENDRQDGVKASRNRINGDGAAQIRVAIAIDGRECEEVYRVRSLKDWVTRGVQRQTSRSPMPFLDRQL